MNDEDTDGSMSEELARLHFDDPEALIEKGRRYLRDSAEQHRIWGSFYLEVAKLRRAAKATVGGHDPFATDNGINAARTLLKFLDTYEAEHKPAAAASPELGR